MSINPSKKTVLLTGASGTVGYQALKQLIEIEDLQLIVFDLKTKNSEKLLEPFRNKVKLIYGDISKKEDVEKVVKDIDYVIHLAAIIPPLADENKALAHKVNVEGSRNLIQSLEKHSPQAFFIYSSSISVYGDRLEDPYINVNDPLIPSPGDEYAVTKIAVEEMIHESQLDWTIFRLAAIMGGHNSTRLMFHQPLNTSLEIATPHDTARAFVLAMKHQAELSKRIFNLGGGESCRTSYQDFLNRSFEIFGLGGMDFPYKAFAEKNFHCGFYEDGDDLENILHFRRHTLEDYFDMEKEKVSATKKVFATILRKPIKHFMLKKSEPFAALKKNDKEEIKQYFD